MRSRDAWLAVIAAALGVSEEACKREAKDAPAAVHDVPSTSASVAAAALSASSDPIATASASAVTSASATPKRDTHASFGGSIGTIGTIGHVGNNSCGATVRQPEPTANVTAHAAGGEVTGDDRVIATLRPRLRYCGNQELKQNPDASGKIVVSVSIAASGDVTAAAVAQNMGASANVAQCMARSVRTAKFPAGSAARTLNIAIGLSADR
jgi:outer membrane biosynthesis protein TonB